MNVSSVEQPPRLLGFTEPDPNRLKYELRASTYDGAAYGFMVGVGETYFALFALAAGLGEIFAGLIASVPLLIGAILQLISPWAILRLKSHRKWVLFCASVQTCCFIPLFFAAWCEAITQTQMLVIISLYWGTCLATSPAWNTWQGTIVPRSMRAKYYGKRSRSAQATTLAGFLVGGIALQLGKSYDEPVRIYMILFGLGFLFRGISTACLWLQSEPVPIPPLMQPFRFAEQANNLLNGKTGRLLLFAVSMQCAVYISAPLFAPYMKQKLNLSYLDFVVILAVSYIAKSATLPIWGRMAHRFGAHQVLFWGAICAAPLAVAWCFSARMEWLIAIQVAAGAAWGAYELALMLLLFETIPEEERTNALTIYNLANNLALLIGSLIGTAILLSYNVSAMGYYTAFAASSMARGLAILILRTVPALHVESSLQGLEGVALNPTLGGVNSPVLSGLPDQTLPDADVVGATGTPQPAGSSAA